MTNLALAMNLMAQMRGRGPRNIEPPEVSGVPEVGEVLTVAAGTWSGTGTVSLSYVWLRDGAVIPGQTALTYTTTASDNGTNVSARETATDDDGTRSMTTGTLPISYTVAVFTVQPTLDAASYTIGDTVTLALGTATGNPSPTTAVTTFTLDGVDKTGGLSGLTWDSTGESAGTIAYRVTATNAAGATPSNIITATLAAGDVTAPTGTDAFVTPVGGEDLRLQITDLSENATYYLAVVDTGDNAPTFNTGTNVWTAGASSTLRDTVSQAVVVDGGPYSIALADTLDGNYDVYRVRADAAGNYSAVEQIGTNVAISTVVPSDWAYTGSTVTTIPTSEPWTYSGSTVTNIPGA